MKAHKKTTSTVSTQEMGQAILWPEERRVLTEALKQRQLGLSLHFTNSGLFWEPGCQDAVQLLTMKGILTQVGRVEYMLTEEGENVTRTLRPDEG